MIICRAERPPGRLPVPSQALQSWFHVNRKWLCCSMVSRCSCAAPMSGWGRLTNASICCDMRLYARKSAADSGDRDSSPPVAPVAISILPMTNKGLEAENRRAEIGARNDGGVRILCRLRIQRQMNRKYCRVDRSDKDRSLQSGDDEKAEISDSIGQKWS